MFSAITVTRTFLKMIVGTPLARIHWLFNAEEVQKDCCSSGTPGGNRGWKVMLDFAGKRWWYLATGIILVTISLVILAIPPFLRPGIEFTSGSSFTMEFQAVTCPTARSSSQTQPGQARQQDERAWLR